MDNFSELYSYFYSYILCIYTYTYAVGFLKYKIQNF